MQNKKASLYLDDKMNITECNFIDSFIEFSQECMLIKSQKPKDIPLHHTRFKMFYKCIMHIKTWTEMLKVFGQFKCLNVIALDFSQTYIHFYVTVLLNNFES